DETNKPTQISQIPSPNADNSTTDAIINDSREIKKLSPDKETSLAEEFKPEKAEETKADADASEVKKSKKQLRKEERERKLKMLPTEKKRCEVVDYADDLSEYARHQTMVTEARPAIRS